jgi:predicted NAD/FAD-binding protein
MRIAVVGSGIAGNVAAYRLARSHDVTMFEAGAHAGGHSDTHEVEVAGRRLAVDTGFIVYNERTYPRFTALLRELAVGTQESCMSFSARFPRHGAGHPALQSRGSRATRHAGRRADA